ncbi:hypothetical protein QWT87_13385 [Chryseobacterium sp. APV1]|uniref:GAF domain-containing protein n=1 Tax=Chryseobacterium urinae TaxID=3058400 RepID=A0ABT8U643_9FLAO|nr:hypothetical protein [Chryseobacterium sp. APV1]MDO3425887.1 hypothetical protein [Chryseobacterium sp. APV1]
MHETLSKQFFEIIKLSFFQGCSEFYSSFKKIKTYLLGSIGALYSTKDKLIIEIDENFKLFLNDHPWLKALFFFVLVIVLLFIYYQIKQFLIQSWRRYILIKRESVYGNAIVLLSEGYAKIHHNKNKELTVEEVKAILIEFCDKIRDIYEFKTKSKCSVSIKTIIDLKIEGNGINFDTRVVNLCRDSKCSRYSMEKYDEIEHNIANNTCYQNIISKFFSNKFDEMYFLSNDILSIDNYENSSFQLYPEYNNEKRLTLELRKKHFPLKYKSELVVSISPMISEKRTTSPILGFLCVDCELSNEEVFTTRFDVPLLKGVSDGLYDFIKSKLHN